MEEQKPEFYLQGTDVSEGFHAFKKINFEWNMLYACNFRCPHCIFDGKWEEYGPRTVYLSPAEWMKHWKRIYDLYGSCTLTITGGEPFMYPEFVTIMEQVSALHYPINISTNSSGDLKDFVRRVDPAKVSLTLSFQPGFNTIEEIIERVELLRENGFFVGYVNLCAFPPYLADLDRYAAAANARKVALKVIPYYGMFNGKSYPDSYSDSEKKLLGINTAWEENVKRKGRWCRAGKESALIFPDGKVARCGQIGERHLVGNFFDADFKLFDRALPCDAELCPCLEGALDDD